MLGLARRPPGHTTDIEEQPLHGHDGRLFGILTRPRPALQPGRPAIILASAGAVHRIGASRLYVTMARAWAERGFPVLRLDIGGIGDSPPFPGMTENDTYSARAVADIGEAAAALPERVQDRRTGGRRALFRCARRLSRGTYAQGHRRDHHDESHRLLLEAK